MAIRVRGSLDKHVPAAFQLPALPLLWLQPLPSNTKARRPHQRPFAPAAPSPARSHLSSETPPSKDPLLPADWAAGCSASQQLPLSEVNPIQFCCLSQPTW